MAATISRFADQVQTVRMRTLHDPATQDIVIEGLERLLDAFTRRDADAAAGRMGEFIAHAEARFFAVGVLANEAREELDKAQRA
jgi:DNA-binding GntR family transcriptional regulator